MPQAALKSKMYPYISDKYYKNGDISFSGKDLKIIRNALRKFTNKKQQQKAYYDKQKKSDTNENTIWLLWNPRKSI